MFWRLAFIRGRFSLRGDVTPSCGFRAELLGLGTFRVERIHAGLVPLV